MFVFSARNAGVRRLGYEWMKIKSTTMNYYDFHRYYRYNYQSVYRTGNLPIIANGNLFFRFGQGTWLKQQVVPVTKITEVFLSNKINIRSE